MKIRQITQTTFAYIHFSNLSVIILMLTLFSVTAYTQQYDCSQPGGCSIMVTDYYDTVVYADTYFGPNYSLNRTYTGETYTFDIMPVFTGINVATYWPSSDWGDCDEVGVFYSITPNQTVTTELWGEPHMYLDATFPGSGSWTLTAGHDGWSCQQYHCGTTVNGCDDYMLVTLSSPPTPTPIASPTPTPTPTSTPTPRIEIASPANNSDFDLNANNNVDTQQISFVANISPSSAFRSNTISWTFNLVYQTSGGKGTTNWPTETGNTSSGQSLTKTFSERGGRLTVQASAELLNGGTLSVSHVYTITGVSIPTSGIITRLKDLYDPETGGTDSICCGIADRETDGAWNQFATRTLYNRSDLWPNESYDGGSHIGVMQVPVTGIDGFSWLTCTNTGVSMYEANIQQSHNHENNEQNKHPNLRDLTSIEHENNASSIYRWGSYYYIPNAAGTDWIRDSDNNLIGCNYADNIRQRAANF